MQDRQIAIASLFTIVLTGLLQCCAPRESSSPIIATSSEASAGTHRDPTRFKLDDESRAGADDSNSPRTIGSEYDELEEPLWVEGLLLQPPGSIHDKTLAVVAVELPEDADEDTPQPGDLSHARRLIDSGARNSRRLLNGDSRFRVPVPRDARQVLLFVDGRYLFLRRAVAVNMPFIEAEEIVLEPDLGAYVTCHIKLQADREALDPTKLFVELSTISSSRENTEVRGIQRRVRPDEALLAEFRGLPPGSRASVFLNYKPLAQVNEYAPKLVAGEHTELDFELRSGARIRGLVVDEAGKPIEGAQVRLRPASLPPNYRMSGRARISGWVGSFLYNRYSPAPTIADGSFEIAGIEGGLHVRVRAKADGYVEGDSDAIELPSDAAEPPAVTIDQVLIVLARDA